MKHLVIVDGMGFLFRAYHAVRGGLTRKDGMPTNALYGFAQMLVKVVDDLKPDECVVALDSKGKNWRHAIYPAYKANRLPPEEDMAVQLPFVEPLVKAFGLPSMRLDGVEADDIIATLVRRHSADRVTIVTSDKDLLQLVDGKVKLLDTLKEKWSGREEAVEKFGVPPELVLQVQALMGDSSDNIPGVPGVGPKTAAELVRRFGKLEDIYARIHEIERETLRKKLEEHKEQAFMCRELANLKYDVALPACDIGFHPRLHEAADYLRAELEFNTLAARLEKRRNGEGTEKAGEKVTPERQKAAPAGAGAAPEEAGRDLGDGRWGNYECVTTLEAWKGWMKLAREAGVVAFDTETTSLNPYGARLVGVSLSVGAGKACYVPVKARGTRNEERGQGDLFAAGEGKGPHGVEGLEVLDDLRALLVDPRVKKVGHNLKYDWEVVAHALGVTPGDTGDGLQRMIINYEDTMLMSACLDGGRWGHGMDELVARHLGHKMISYEEVCGKGKAQVTFDRVGLEAATAYAAEDADATWRMWEMFSKRLVEEGESTVASGAILRSGAPAPSAGLIMPSASEALPSLGVKFVYELVERPLLPVIVAMEARGVCVDGGALRALSSDFAGRMAAWEKEIWRLAGHEFNVQSTQQLAGVLFDELGLGTEKQKKSRSTAVGVLEELAGEGEGDDVASGAILQSGAPSPLSRPSATGKPAADLSNAARGAAVAGLVLQYRQLAKLRSTYAETLVNEVQGKTGRIHTSYNQVGAATGRFSSNDPNLQNIPIRTEEGRKIRKAFVPQEGWVMVSADYSQIELRLLAHFSGSPALRRAFREGFDIHAYTASLIHGVEMKDVSRDQRRAAKVINFGLVYGMGARSMAANIGAGVADAQAWIDAYFRRYEGVREYMDGNKQKARELGYVETLCGRRVWLPEIKSSNGGLRAGAERAAINAPLQGSNADVIKLAMPQVERALAGMPTRLLMQVHDELVLECAPEAVEDVKKILPEVMGGVVRLEVPLAVEVGVGADWDAAH